MWVYNQKTSHVLQFILIELAYHIKFWRTIQNLEPDSWFKSWVLQHFFIWIRCLVLHNSVTSFCCQWFDNNRKLLETWICPNHIFLPEACSFLSQFHPNWWTNLAISKVSSVSKNILQIGARHFTYMETYWYGVWECAVLLFSGMLNQFRLLRVETQLFVDHLKWNVKNVFLELCNFFTELVLQLWLTYTKLLNKNQAQHTIHVPPKKIKPWPFVPPKKQHKKWHDATG
jgi:hypothetical protein